MIVDAGQALPSGDAVKALHLDALAVTVASTVASTTEAGKPSIAVLPFQNMNGDPEQEYFADGVTVCNAGC